MNVRSAWSLAVLAAALCIVMSCASTDAGITTSVQSKRAMDDLVKASRIEVTTKNGNVTLAGNMDSELAMNQALQLERETARVRMIAKT